MDSETLMAAVEQRWISIDGCHSHASLALGAAAQAMEDPHLHHYLGGGEAMNVALLPSGRTVGQEHSGSFGIELGTTSD